MVKSDDVVCITEKGQTVKVRQRDLPTLGRTAQGVKVVAIAKDDSALGLASVAKEV
jgi:DNA gyrase/topoisomerase IV subunit A